jgi:hypothetical protein
MATTPTRYTFRNTPSRETDGAYEKLVIRCQEKYKKIYFIFHNLIVIFDQIFFQITQDTAQ